MSYDKKMQTELKYDGGNTSVTFSGRPQVLVTGLSGLDGKPNAWSPPHLFISSIESCFLMTLLTLAPKMRLEIKTYSSTAQASITSADGKHYEVGDITIRPRLTLANAADSARIPQLLKMAEEHCPVARSVRTKINIELS